MPEGVRVDRVFGKEPQLGGRTAVEGGTQIEEAQPGPGYGLLDLRVHALRLWSKRGGLAAGQEQREQSDHRGHVVGPGIARDTGERLFYAAPTGSAAVVQAVPFDRPVRVARVRGRELRRRQTQPAAHEVEQIRPGLRVVEEPHRR